MSGLKSIKGGFSLIPPPPDVCQECAVDHEPEAPHNAQSMHYQYSFYADHNRWPTWKDAIAHCSDEARAVIEKMLREQGEWTEPEENRCA